MTHWILRGIDGDERALLWSCWAQLWVGATRALGGLPEAQVEGGPPAAGAAVTWRLTVAER